MSARDASNNLIKLFPNFGHRNECKTLAELYNRLHLLIIKICWS